MCVESLLEDDITTAQLMQAVCMYCIIHVDHEEIWRHTVYIIFGGLVISI